MPTPTILPKPSFNLLPPPSPPSNPYIVGPLNTPCVSVQAKVPASLVLQANHVVNITIQQTGSGPTGPYPTSTVYSKPLTQDYLNLGLTFIGSEVCTLKNFPTNTNYTLKLEIIDTTGLLIALATNFLIRIV